MTSRKRKHIPLAEQLAAALACLLPQEQRDELRARRVPARQVIRLFSPDHLILHAWDGPDRWWNIDPKLREVHKTKSAKDTSRAFKAKRIDDKWKDFVGTALKPIPRKEPRRKWPSRPMGRRK